MGEQFLQEKELLRRIAEGDEKAFRTVFDHYKGRFYAAALKMTRSADTAEEIVQEVFVTLWLRRSVLVTVENPASYLFTIVYNNIHKHFRKQALEKRMKQNVSERMSAAECPAEDLLIEKENRQLLQEAVGRLPPRQRIIYQLSKQEGLSRDEIANRLHLSPNTVKNHLLKAVKYVHLHCRKALVLLICFFI